MMHYLSERKTCDGVKHECLCWNGSFEENRGRNLTSVQDRVECPHCRAILAMADSLEITEEQARLKYRIAKYDEWKREHPQKEAT